MKRLIWLGTIASVLSPLTAWSQEAPAIVAGSRIRITEIGAVKSELRSGTVVTAGADTIVLRLDSSGDLNVLDVRAPFPLGRISKIELSQGLQGHTADGFGIGLLAGAGAGALAAVVKFGSRGYEIGSDTYPTELVALVWGGIGGVLGMLTGAMIGSTHKTERWESLPASRWHAGIGPASSGGIALALAARF